MIYLMSLRKYFFTFLKTALFFTAALSFYLLVQLMSLKFRGESQVLTDALINYAWFLAYSLPLMIIVASAFYFGLLGNDKRFALRMVPMVAGLNSIILIAFLLIKFDFMLLTRPQTLTFTPQVQEGTMNSLGDYKIYLEKAEKGKSRLGILFHNNAYFFNGLANGKKSIEVTTYQTVGEYGLSYQGRSFSIPKKEPVMALKETGIGQMVMDRYIGLIKKLRDNFQATYKAGGLVPSVLGFFLMAVGFFGLLAGTAAFLNEKQTLILTYSALMMTGLAFFLLFPSFLGLVLLIQFGIKLGVVKVLIPSLFVGAFLGMGGYGLIELRELLQKRGGSRT